MARANREAKPVFSGMWGRKLARSVGLLGKRAASSPTSAPTISGTRAPPPCAEVHPGRIQRTFVPLHRPSAPIWPGHFFSKFFQI